MKGDGISKVVLTCSTSKRVLHDTTNTYSKRRAKKIVVYSPSSANNVWYYTRGKPPSAVKSKDRWMLSVGYYCKPERKGCKSNPRLRARSIDCIFKCNQILATFPSHCAAQLYVKQFCRRVGYIVREDREKKTLCGKIVGSQSEMVKQKRLDLTYQWNKELQKKMNEIKVSLVVACNRRKN